jgi:hypothetical protein
MQAEVVGREETEGRAYCFVRFRHGGKGCGAFLPILFSQLPCSQENDGLKCSAIQRNQAENANVIITYTLLNQGELKETPCHCDP